MVRTWNTNFDYGKLLYYFRCWGITLERRMLSTCVRRSSEILKRRAWCHLVDPSCPKSWNGS